jgi:hypothetical protein
MLKNILMSIENRRKSENSFWRMTILMKDIVWKLLTISEHLAISLKIRLAGGKLPDFLVIGVQKGGTTSLWFHLRKHPQIEMAPNFKEIRENGKVKLKEVGFFSNRERWKRGLVWYATLFNRNNKLQGEATPDYISALKAHKNIFKTVPKAKLIIILRDPVTRTYSAFNHIKEDQASWGVYDSSKNFEYNLEKEMKGEGGSLLEKGVYINQIKNLLKFYPRKQLLILISERMKEHPQEAYNKIFAFLGIKKMKIEYEPGVHSRKYPEKMKKSTEKKLYRFFKTYNERLFKFLGYRISEWERH